MRRDRTGAQDTAPLFVDRDKEIKRARNCAYRYLAIRSRSRREVEARLEDRGYPPETVRAVMEHLVRLGYVDDIRFARDWAAGRVRTRGFGRRRVEQELRARGIDREIIGETLRTLYEDRDEETIARNEAEKRRRTLMRLDPLVRRRRLAGFLERRGFPPQIIRAILRDEK